MLTEAGSVSRLWDRCMPPSPQGQGQSWARAPGLGTPRSPVLPVLGPLGRALCAPSRSALRFSPWSLVFHVYDSEP